MTQQFIKKYIKTLFIYKVLSSCMWRRLFLTSEFNFVLMGTKNVSVIKHSLYLNEKKTLLQELYFYL